MANKIMKQEIKKLIAKHLEKYGAQLGYRNCKYNFADDCLGTSKECNFRHKMCSSCYKAHQKLYYKQRIVARGYAAGKVGRPMGSLRPKKTVDVSDDDKIDSDEEEIVKKKSTRKSTRSA